MLYHIAVLDLNTGREVMATYAGADLRAAITTAQAEAHDTNGGRNVAIGIAPEYYAEADRLGIAYNIADGLLL